MWSRSECPLVASRNEHESEKLPALFARGAGHAAQPIAGANPTLCGKLSIDAQPNSQSAGWLISVSLAASSVLSSPPLPCRLTSALVQDRAMLPEPITKLLEFRRDGFAFG